MSKTFILSCIAILFVYTAWTQSTTTGSITGIISDQLNHPLSNVNIILTHLPSGIQYGTTSNANGHYTLQGLRVGGPYSLLASHLGYANQNIENISIKLGSATFIKIVLTEASVELQNEIVVSGHSNTNFHPSRTGATTQIDKRVIEQIPTISRNINDIARLVPQFKKNAYMGQLIILNNYTIDGSSINNSFGLGSHPGERTGVAALSLETLEQIQVNVAPFDVRQSNFIGAGVNMVSKSGSNKVEGSVYYQGRNQAFVGKNAAGADFNPGQFGFNMGGGYFSGPIIKNKLFFLISFESEKYARPATPFIANNGSEPVGGNVTRVLKSDLEELSQFLKTNFDYETGAYDSYDFVTSATRITGKIDYSINTHHKISIHYNQLKSNADQPISNHYVLGNGFRTGSTNGLSFENSNYSINENINSIIGEWNSTYGSGMSNNLIAGYRFHDETRSTKERLFPLVDILKDGYTYTTFGTEPFSPYAGVKYGSLQLQDNVSWLLKKHLLLFGFNIEKFWSDDSFFPGAQSVYVYNSLDDFYNDAKGYLNNPEQTLSDVNLKRFQVRYSNIPNIEQPTQSLSVIYTGVYMQDRWYVSDNFTTTMGLRVDVPFIAKPEFNNTQAEQLDFKDETGKIVRYSTAEMPGAFPLFSPRVGFNWNVNGDNTTQLRGGSGIFTSQPPYIFLSNQIDNNGILRGYQVFDGTNDFPLYTRPFNPDPNAYKPTNVTGQAAEYYELALVDPNFKFPQIWRNNLAADITLPLEMLATIELIYDKDINGIYYINANLPEPDGQFTGPDTRLYWTNKRIQPHIANAVVLKNDNKAYAWNISAMLERQYKNGLYAKAGYAYGESKNTNDPTPMASASWAYNAISHNPNQADLSYAKYSPGHRLFALLSYEHNFFKIGNTAFSIFIDRFSTGRVSYTYSGDLNGDGSPGNDLLYIPNNQNEMNFIEYTAGGKIYTAEQQAAAWDAYISQDAYLNKRRGKYAERYGYELPYVTRLDASISQSVKATILGKSNKLLIRLDIINLTNLLNPNWGVGQNLISSQPLIARGTDLNGQPSYNLQGYNGELLQKTLIKTAALSDVYQMQLSVKWLFNQ